MGFAEAVKSALSGYAKFSGRARRSEYWWFALFLLLAVGVAAGLDAAVGTETLIMGLVFLALLLPTIAVSVRRLHDTGRSGWFYLLNWVPIVGPILLLVWFVSDSHPDNQYGPSPKGAPAYKSA
jgi:uncharacterized membrane protein YhaH (DUF805 family)